jgi:YVTN family beta-propeller protein
VVLSVPIDPTRPALATQVDVFGETVTGQANVGPQASPTLQPTVSSTALSLDAAGSPLYTTNSDGTVSSAPVGGQGLQTKNVKTSSLPGGAVAASIFAQTSALYAAEPTRNAVAVLIGSPAAVKTEIPVGTNPVYIVGTAGGQRIFAVSQAANTVTAIETSSNTITATLPVGAGPVYGVETANARRAFIVNKAGNSVTVIDAQQSQVQQTIPVGVAPVWADIDITGNQLIVANSGSNSVTIINIALDVFGNNAPGFGTAVTVPVGPNPVAVSVLQDGTRAYTANQADGSVSVVNLQSKTLSHNIALPAANGHPTSIAAATGSPKGLVFLTSPDSQLLSIIRTDTDSLDASLQVNGAGAAVRLTSQ